MRVLTVCIAVAVSLAAGDSAMAQAKPGGAPPPPASPPPAGSFQFQAQPSPRQFRNDIITEAGSGSTDVYVTGSSDAELLAVAEHDTQMAEKVPAVCRAKTAGKL